MPVLGADEAEAVFLKERPNAWRYCGMLQFVDYVTDGRTVANKARSAGRSDTVVGMLVFEDPTQVGLTACP